MTRNFSRWFGVEISRWFLCLLLVLLWSDCRSVLADFRYQASSESVTITGYDGAAAVLVIPGSLNGVPVTSIGDWAFYGRGELTSVSIPSSVTSIGGNAFGYCAKMVSFTVDSQNAAYASAAGVLFNKSRTRLISCPSTKKGAFTIPNGVTSIGNSAFAWCSALTSVRIPSGVTSIGDDAFSGCSGITSIAIPNGVTSIGSGVFASCSALARVDIPRSVTSIVASNPRDATGVTHVGLGGTQGSFQE